VSNFKNIFLLLGTCAILVACAAPTPDNNMGYLMESTGNYTPQDNDTLQNGYQEFQGQLDYMQGHDQEKAAAANDEAKIQDSMVDDYQNQIESEDDE
jgi:outer membrane biogenesis lipoprotein LolB